MTNPILNMEPLFDRAARAYISRCQRENWIPQQPSQSGSSVKVDHKKNCAYVVLRNCRSELARYVLKNGRLRYVEGRS